MMVHSKASLRRAAWLVRAQEFMRAGAFDFGGIIVFYLLLYTLGLKAAIGGTLAFLVVDAVRRLRLRLGFPRIYVLSSALAVVFGVVDLASTTPFMIKYEAVITSAVLGLMFAAGARGKSILQELVEQREGPVFDAQPDVRRFFQLMTLMWAIYFLAKAFAYAWLGEIMPIERLLEIRPVIGIVSMVVMIGISTQGQRLFALAHRLRLLPTVLPKDPAAERPALEHQVTGGPGPPD